MSVTFTLSHETTHPEFGAVIAQGCRNCHAECFCRELEVNLSNTNAAQVLDRLGLEWDDGMGSADADDFTGRTLVGNVGRDDSGAESVQDGRIIHCGLPAGYFEGVMERLSDLAAAAKRHDCIVGWC